MQQEEKETKEKKTVERFGNYYRYTFTRTNTYDQTQMAATLANLKSTLASKTAQRDNLETQISELDAEIKEIEKAMK